MRHHLLSILSCAALSGSVHGYEAAPARIISSDKTIENTFVFQETMDGVQFVIDDPSSPIKSSLNHKQYQRIEYGPPKDGNFQIAEIKFESGDNEKALAAYAKVSATTYQWVVERSVLRSAEVLNRLNRTDEGLKRLDDFLTKNPKSARVPEAISLHAELRLAKGDLAGADQDYSKLITNAEAWSISPVTGTLGRVDVLRREKKITEAAKLLQPAFAALTPADSIWAKAGLTLGELQAVAAQKDAALATFRLVAFTSAISNAARCDAHLGLARVLADGATGQALAAAFDHAALATRDGASDATGRAARTLANELAGRIKTDAAFAEPERKEYSEYARSL